MRLCAVLSQERQHVRVAPGGGFAAPKPREAFVPRHRPTHRVALGRVHVRAVAKQEVYHGSVPVR